MLDDKARERIEKTEKIRRQKKEEEDGPFKIKRVKAIINKQIGEEDEISGLRVEKIVVMDDCVLLSFENDFWARISIEEGYELETYPVLDSKFKMSPYDRLCYLRTLDLISEEEYVQERHRFIKTKRNDELKGRYQLYQNLKEEFEPPKEDVDKELFWEEFKEG